MELRKHLTLLLFLTLVGSSNCQKSSTIEIIPQPVSVKTNEGSFNLTADTRIYLPENKPDWETAAQYLMILAQQSTGYHLVSQPLKKEFRDPRPNSIYFLPDSEIGSPEGYKLEVTPRSVFIRAQTAAGAFYAVQTLRQLFPPGFNGTAPSDDSNTWTAPACVIEDAPRFVYRGLHLDAGRHFFPVSFVKKYIDLLAAHKLNTFHWHLTEDQGWRIEIKKYPKLHTVAACRKETLIGHYSDQPQRFDGKEYCGYYTQEDVKEVVEYAKKRFVTIIPEIEMPGHSLAALSAYPELGCTGGPYAAGTYWGVFDDVFCAGNEKTFGFLDDVLAEVCALFPGKYVHVGGDECPKTRWETCPKCQKRMKDQGLKDGHELQSYFIRRAETLLAKHGKKLIGWDEILEGGLAPTAAVMSWRGTEGGIAAAKAHHEVVMTPGSHVYYNYYQSDPMTEPVAIGGYTTLEKTYGYEPVPEELGPEEAKYILGAQANLWTEYIKTPEHAEYMAYPRTCALAEVVWTAKEKKNWPEFARRMRGHFSRLDALKVNYARSYFDVTSSYSNGKISLAALDSALKIRFTTDGKEPAATSREYTGPIAISKNTTLKSAVFEKDKPMGKVLTVKYLVHKASGKTYTMPRIPDQYTGGEQYALTNGVTGNIKTWGSWVGLVNHDIDPVIDLGAPTSFSAVTTHFVNSKVSWIYPPRGVEVYGSDDGQNFNLLAKQDVPAESMRGISVETIRLETPGAKARYLKFVAKTFGVIPDGEAGAGNGAWLFIDEVIVE
ncbi:MAG: family 20 glycosylhydrolase [Lewinellaceae bacterium]|nr:family 20 glycosylhydrolase [Lewinellaceae bacterium]